MQSKKGPASPESSLFGDKAGRGALIVVSLALMTDMLLYGMAVPILPSIARDFGASSSSLGLLFGVYALTMLASMPLVGLWVDRAGPRGPLLLGLVGLALATLLFAVGPSYGFLIAARALQGASAAVSWTAGLALLAASFPPERRGAAMGAAMSAMSLGTLLGPPAGGYLFDHFGRAAPFLLGAAVAAADAAARILLVRPRPESAAPVRAGETRPGETRASSLLGSKGLWSCLAMASGGAAIIAALEPVLPQLGFAAFGLGPTALGLAFAAASIVGVLAYPLAGLASDRWPARRVAALGLVVSACAYAALSLVDSALAMGACLVAAAVGASFVLAPTVGLIAKVAEATRPPAYGAAYSLYNIAYGAGLAAGPLAAAFAYGQFGLGALSLGGTLLLGGAALALALIARTRSGLVV